MLCAWHVTETSETQNQKPPSSPHSTGHSTTHLQQLKRIHEAVRTTETNVAFRTDTRERMTAVMVRTA